MDKLRLLWCVFGGLSCWRIGYNTDHCTKQNCCLGQGETQCRSFQRYIL